MKTKNLYIALMVLTALFLFTAQSVNALTEVPATVAYSALTADPSAVMFDTRSVDEYYGCEPPWVGSACPNLADPGNNGTATWVVTGLTATRLPFNVPLWIEDGDSDTEPENPAETTDIIEALLAAGQIDFGTEIYLICRSAWRSHYMGLWMENNTFFNALTGVTASFTNLYDIDSAGDPNAGTGGMLEWTAASLPKLEGDGAMPPQVISHTKANLDFPDDIYVTSNGYVVLEVKVLEPTPGTNGAITGYVTVTDVCVDITGATDPPCVTTGSTGVITTYTFDPVNLGGTCNDSYTWTSSASNGLINFSPNAMSSDDNDSRTVIIGPIPEVLINDTLPGPFDVKITTNPGLCLDAPTNYYVCAEDYSANNYGEFYYTYDANNIYNGPWSSGVCQAALGAATPLLALNGFPVLQNILPADYNYKFCLTLGIGATLFTDCDFLVGPPW